MSSFNFVKLGDVAYFIRGITFKPSDTVEPYSQESVVCMRTKNIQEDLDQNDLLAVHKSFVKRKEQYLSKGDILVSSANSWELVGKCSWIPQLSYESTAGGFISILRGDVKKVYPRYLFHWFSSPPIQHKLRYCGRKTTSISNLSYEQALEIEIPLPPLAEQKRIADIMDKADAICRKRQQAIKLAGDFLRSTFLDMFGDPVNNPKGWEWGTVRDLVSEVKYGTSHKADISEGNYAILRMNNLTYEGRLDISDLKYVNLTEVEQNKYLAQKGDLLFNRTNSKELVGKTAVYDLDYPMAIAGYLIRVRANKKANSHYISGYLNSRHGKQTLVSMCKSIVGMANINAQELQDIKILKPPTELQHKYAQMVHVIELKKAKFLDFSDQGYELFNSLSQRAFRGEL